MIAEYDIELGADRLLQQSRHQVSRGSSAGGAAFGRLLGAAHIFNGLERSIGAHVKQVRRARCIAEPRKFRPVEFDLGPANQLIDVKIRIGSQQSQAVGFSDGVNKIRRYDMARAGHVLNQNARIAGNMLSHVRRDHARVNVVQVAGLAARDNGNCLTLIIGSLRCGAGHRTKQNDQ